MDSEVYAYCQSGLKTSTLVLNDRYDIKLVRLFHVAVHKDKQYILEIYILVGDKFISIGLLGFMHFKEELNLFERSDCNNKFFDKSQKDNVITLRLKNFEEPMYIYKSEAKGIVSLLDKVFINYTLQSILEIKIKICKNHLFELMSNEEIYQLEDNN